MVMFTKWFFSKGDNKIRHGIKQRADLTYLRAVYSHFETTFCGNRAGAFSFCCLPNHLV